MWVLPLFRGGARTFLGTNEVYFGSLAPNLKKIKLYKFFQVFKIHILMFPHIWRYIFWKERMNSQEKTQFLILSVLCLVVWFICLLLLFPNWPKPSLANLFIFMCILSPLYYQLEISNINCLPIQRFRFYIVERNQSRTSSETPKTFLEETNNIFEYFAILIWQRKNDWISTTQ